ncbi:flagellar hook-associated protein 3 FlgL [Rhodovulum sp. ES.010]|uniref:flagellin n=1 Tax=Rhodovulum sp. ES.010 TaxID=1882821 RepID=UPI00092CDC16|nr:flagellin [Rhodovulum sp. ES.010]SIO49737.1 flagellar hook-associated protein 3 FlgL [Rhodovulum sp. ES.010]
MSFVSIGDLARSFNLRNHTAEIKARLDRLGEEVTTGQTTDPAGRLRGDFRSLGAIDRSLKVMDSYDLATKEAALTTDAMQLTLARISDAATTLSPSLLDASTMHSAQTVEALGKDAREWFELSVASLNNQTAGRSLFAGAATDSRALASGEDMLAAIQTSITGLTQAEDVLTAIDAWFDTPGGAFESSGYLGSDLPTGKVRLNDSHSMQLDVTAADPEIRDALKAFATAAVLSDPTVLAGDLSERSELAGAAGERMMSSNGGLIDLMAEVGIAQSRIEEIGTENAANRNLLDLARADMLAVDQYEAASDLQAVQVQLETVYTVTARLSRLSLADYL